jgi:NAD(P)-dependent dehydrogenase (short-subunit alcohol dehydrogenase family)
MNPTDPLAAFDLSGRVALVTGARRGIGRAIAIGLAAVGARVAIHHTGTAEETADAAEVVSLCAGRGAPFAADFSDPDAAGGLASAVAAQLGPVDILVLNASIEVLQDFANIDLATFERQIAINLRAPLQLIQALVPPMQRRGWGRVMAIGSIQQLRAHPQMLVYAGTKSAQLNWVRNLAGQVGPDGVTVNNLAPGAIQTARNLNQFADPAARAAFEARVPVRRLGQPEDLVGAALLLCSPAGAYINGADFFVDGGLHASGLGG